VADTHPTSHHPSPHLCNIWADLGLEMSDSPSYRMPRRDRRSVRARSIVAAWLAIVAVAVAVTVTVTEPGPTTHGRVTGTVTVAVTRLAPPARSPFSVPRQRFSNTSSSRVLFPNEHEQHMLVGHVVFMLDGRCGFASIGQQPALSMLHVLLEGNILLSSVICYFLIFFAGPECFVWGWGEREARRRSSLCTAVRWLASGAGIEEEEETKERKN